MAPFPIWQAAKALNLNLFKSSAEIMFVEQNKEVFIPSWFISQKVWKQIVIFMLKLFKEVWAAKKPYKLLHTEVILSVNENSDWNSLGPRREW